MKSIKNISFYNPDIAITIHPNIVIQILGALISPLNTFEYPACSCGKQKNYDTAQNPYCGSRSAKKAKNVLFSDLPRVHARHKHAHAKLHSILRSYTSFINLIPPIQNFDDF